VRRFYADWLRTLRPPRATPRASTSSSATRTISSACRDLGPTPSVRQGALDKDFNLRLACPIPPAGLVQLRPAASRAASAPHCAVPPDPPAQTRLPPVRRRRAARSRSMSTVGFRRRTKSASDFFRLNRAARMGAYLQPRRRHDQNIVPPPQPRIRRASRPRKPRSPPHTAASPARSTVYQLTRIRASPPRRQRKPIARRVVRHVAHRIDVLARRPAVISTRGLELPAISTRSLTPPAKA